jgi:4,5-DOPA dioxygenase extradiol
MHDMETAIMPAAFIGHGSPMNTLEDNRWTRAWRAFGRSTPRPTAVLALSAHWWGPGLAVTAMDRPRTIHDFAGFPDELFRVQYPAAGSRELADRVIDLAKPRTMRADTAWGLDHGTWSILAHVYPDADVPVVQMSLDSTLSFDEHVALGAALAPLRDEGVLVLASGDIVHNLGVMDWGAAEAAFPWAQEFDDAARALLTTDPARLGSLVSHPHYRQAVPTAEHFVPALYIAGLAQAAGTGAEVLISGSAFGSISLTSYVVR